ncbi:SMI1/KNR4 family protein [Streptomyces sp. I05A-00742]|uniref:SMI1/KNR4 family protein n=1 Tax=Streptomyces sp. I05A-00742 TaxID=2732853 RepID=UPI001488A315|nr:SMI1/KNR4 family protein [Streptomyces sp. I05A-00742]
MDFDFRAELEELAEEIRRDPLLELVEFEVGDPVPEDTIKAAEARFGTPLPTQLRRFYLSLGNVNLYWCFTSSLDEETCQRIAKRDPYMISDSGLFDGAIRIVTLEDMLFNEEFTMPQLEWDEGEEPEFDFAGTVYTDNEFSRMVRHFDAVDDYWGPPPAPPRT